MERKVITMRSMAALAFVLLLAPIGLRAEEASDQIVSYLQRYHRLRARDVEGRLRLAQWCAEREMFDKQADLLLEVVKLDPQQDEAYTTLLALDAKRNRAVDTEWSRKLERLLGESFHLRHSLHFTFLSDVDTDVVDAAAQAMEDAYIRVYRDTVKLGMRPVPPSGRLVCVLFNEYDQYRDFERRYELADNQWATGAYSWRTNRTAFFYERDHPALKEYKERIAEAERKLSGLRDEMEELPANDTSGRVKLAAQMKQYRSAIAQMKAGMNNAVRIAMAAKTSHEATHQILYNSGLEQRGREYPFWFNEGLATLFEVGDSHGHAGPGSVNHYRLNSYHDAREANRLMKLEYLITHRPSDSEQAQIVAEWYGQAWALAHFLWNRHPASFAEYWRDLEAHGAPRDWKAFFIRHFGDDLDGLEADFRTYANGLPR